MQTPIEGAERIATRNPLTSDDTRSDADACPPTVEAGLLRVFIRWQLRPHRR